MFSCIPSGEPHFERIADSSTSACVPCNINHCADIPPSSLASAFAKHWLRFFLSARVGNHLQVLALVLQEFGSRFVCLRTGQRFDCLILFYFETCQLIAIKMKIKV